MNTKGLILAAGRGSRMGELTASKPKCLTILADKPLIEWQKNAFLEAGFNLPALVTGYQAAQLEPYGLQTFYNAAWAHTNMVASLLAAKALWRHHTEVLVSYSDIVYKPEYLQRLAGSPGEIAITYDKAWLSLWSQRNHNPLNDAETFETNSEGLLMTIGETPTHLSQVQGQYMGLLKITPTGLQCITDLFETLTIEEQAALHMTGLLQKLLQQGKHIYTVPVDGGWCEVDTPEDAALYETCLNLPEPWLHDWRQLEREEAYL